MKQLTEEQRALADAAFSQRLNVVHHAYVDITGDLIAGSLLGQILYWFGVGANGKQRARIQRDGHTWIAKTRSDWWDEIRITPKQYDRAAKVLKDKGFIVIKTMKFAGNPTTHIRIVPEAINSAIDAWKREQVADMEQGTRSNTGNHPSGDNDVTQEGNPLSTFGEERNQPKGNNDIAENGTSSITENTVIDSSIDHHQTNGGSANAPLDYDTLKTDFERVWEQYPKKEGKAKAFHAFSKALANGATALEILAEVVLYRQYIDNALERGEISYRYIPNGGRWFEDECWVNEYPSIGSSFDDMLDGMEHNRRSAELRRIAAEAGTADAAEADAIRRRMEKLIESMPY